MHPTFHQDLVQSRQRDLMRAAAQQRLAAEVKAARAKEARRARRATEPRWHVRRLAWRLLPA